MILGECLVIKKRIQKVLWTDSSNVYLYGSTIKYLEHNRVFFENLRFSTGKTIKKWLSKTNFQANRTLPELTLLKPNHTYELVSKLTTVPEGYVIIQINFYNRQKEKIGFSIIRDHSSDFIVPDDTYFYDISLIGAGCISVEFCYLELFEVIETQEEKDGIELNSYVESSLPSELELIRTLIAFSKDKK